MMDIHQPQPELFNHQVNWKVRASRSLFAAGGQAVDLRFARVEKHKHAQLAAPPVERQPEQARGVELLELVLPYFKRLRKR